MKYSRVIFWLFLLVFPAFAHAQTAIDSTLIDATITGTPAGVVRLVGTYCDQNYLADSTFSDAQGHFTIKRKSALAPGFYYFLLPGSKNFSILIDQDQRFTLQAKADDLMNTMQVTGSLNTQLLYENFKFQSQQDVELGRLGEVLRKAAVTSPEYKTAKAQQDQLLEVRKANLEATYKANPTSFFTAFKKAGQNPDFTEFRKPNGDVDTVRQVVTYRNHFFDGVDFNDKRLLNTPVVLNKLRRYMKEFTPQNPDSLIKVSDVLIRQVMPYKDYFKFFTNWIALQYENGKSPVMDGEAVYVHIVRNYFTPELAYWSTAKELEGLQKHVGEMEASLLNRKGMDVRAKNQFGEFKSLYEIKAPLIVIFMYSPDCEHCQKESPEIQRLYEKWKPRGVEFFGIAVNTTEAEWKPFVEKNRFTFANVFDPTNLAIYGKYFVDITPELYVLNKDRTIVAKNLKAEQLETIFERELKKINK